ncbi:MAG: hypothetical protein KC445_18935 [Anaerolineales bacterium]|nr:hypothetical protein [Anaerolineales bacterium]
MFNVSDAKCIIYVQADMDYQELTKFIALLSGGWIERWYMVKTPLFEIDFEESDEFDKEPSKSFPDGFLYFRFSLGVFSLSENFNEDHIAALSALLEKLWANGIPAVAACDYEHLLSKRGGYKDSSLPWP